MIPNSSELWELIQILMAYKFFLLAIVNFFVFIFLFAIYSHFVLVI